MDIVFSKPLPRGAMLKVTYDLSQPIKEAPEPVALMARDKASPPPNRHQRRLAAAVNRKHR
jgi:hypothetical protein